MNFLAILLFWISFITICLLVHSERQVSAQQLQIECAVREAGVYQSRCTLLEKETARLNALVPLEDEKSYSQEEGK